MSVRLASISDIRLMSLQLVNLQKKSSVWPVKRQGNRFFPFLQYVSFAVRSLSHCASALIADVVILIVMPLSFACTLWPFISSSGRTLSVAFFAFIGCYGSIQVHRLPRSL